MTTRTRISAESLGYDLGSRTLWDDVDLDVMAGGVLAIRGPSGEGKSTLLRCLGGLERPHRGAVTVGDVSLGNARASVLRRLRRTELGFVMQDHANVPDWTVEQNLRVLRPAGIGRAVIDTRIGDALLTLGLGGRGRTRTGLLSGGEQQRVAVARVLVQRPRVVLADEPTASLDAESAARVRVGLDALRHQGSAVIVATHDPVLVEWADHVLDLSADQAPASRASAVSGPCPPLPPC